MAEPMKKWLDELDEAINTLVRSIQDDMNYHGDITSRETIRAMDELQLVRSRRPQEAEIA